MNRLLIIVTIGIILGLSVDSAIANPFVYGNKRITLISPTLFRLEYAEGQKFLDDPTLFAHDRQTLLGEYTVGTAEDGRIKITTSALEMYFENDNLPFGNCNMQVFYQHNGGRKTFTARNFHYPGSNLGGAVSTLDEVRKPIPLEEGLLSRDGWYIINDEGREVIKDGWFVARDRDHVQDIYCFVYGNNYREALKDLGRISGHVPMTRKYVHGVWYCRWWPYTEEEVYKLVDEYREHDFPLDIVVLDMDWHTIKEAKQGTGHANNKGWTGYTWNRNMIQNPRELISNLHKDSIYICLNEHPHDGIRSHESMYPDFMKAMDKPADGRNLVFDAGDKKYMENFLKYAHGESWDMGIDFWWLDWQQDYLYPYVRGSNMRHISWLNKLWFEDSERNGKRGAGYSRWAGWGDHRHPIQFSGDAFANWDMLAFEVTLTATSGNAGCYYWAHDIGGFNGGRSPELLARWTQFGAVSAALRVHATRDKDLDRRPWLWGEQAENSMRKAYHFRSRIMPYLYSSIWQTHKTMVPLNRGMYIDYGNDKRAYANPQQFMFGDLLLAAPITSSGEGEELIASQKVWFPEGSLWYDFFDHTLYKGGIDTTVKKNIDEFPLFVKGGYVLPMQEYSERPATGIPEKLILRVYPGNEGDNNTFILYEDDGVTTKYKEGEFSETAFTYQRQGGATSITISPARGKFAGQKEMRSYRLELPALTKAPQVTVGGRKMKTVYDEESNMYISEIPCRTVRKEVVIEMKN